MKLKTIDNEKNVRVPFSDNRRNIMFFIEDYKGDKVFLYDPITKSGKETVVIKVQDALGNQVLTSPGTIIQETNIRYEYWFTLGDLLEKGPVLTPGVYTISIEWVDSLTETYITADGLSLTIKKSGVFNETNN